jgi:hypothetical protein
MIALPAHINHAFQVGHDYGPYLVRMPLPADARTRLADRAGGTRTQRTQLVPQRVAALNPFDYEPAEEGLESDPGFGSYETEHEQPYEDPYTSEGVEDAVEDVAGETADFA